MGPAAPLIVTAVLDAAAQERFDALRRTHFPPERNHLAAHVTLFHALPGEQEAAVRRDLAEVAAGAPYEVEVVGVRLLGRGVAYDLRSPALSAARAELARRWAPWLTRQDAQGFRPHVTVQNKVEPDVARRLHADLVRSVRAARASRGGTGAVALPGRALGAARRGHRGPRGRLSVAVADRRQGT